MDSQGIRPPTSVTQQLALTYKLTLRESDRSLIFPILSQVQLASPQAFLWHQAAYPFVHMVNPGSHKGTILRLVFEHRALL